MIRKAAAHSGDTRPQRCSPHLMCKLPPSSSQTGSEAPAPSRSPDSSSVGSETAEKIFNRIAAQGSDRQPRQGLHRGRRPQQAAGSPQRLHIEDCLRGFPDLEC
jgi:hypothetical protein